MTTPGTNQNTSSLDLFLNSSSNHVTIATERISLEQVERKLFGIYVYALSFIVVYMSVGFLGNILVIFIFKFHWKMKKTTVYILALSFVDFFSCVFNMPIEVAILSNPLSFDHNIICKISRFTSFLTTASTSFLLVAIAIDRYFMVCRPFKSMDLGIRYAQRACAVAFILGIFSSFPAVEIYGTFTVPVQVSENTTMYGKTCYVTNYYQVNRILPFAYLVYMFGGHVVIFTIFFVLYVLIGRQIFLSISVNMPVSRTNSLKALGRGLMAAITGEIPAQFMEDNRSETGSMQVHVETEFRYSQGEITELNKLNNETGNEKVNTASQRTSNLFENETGRQIGNTKDSDRTTIQTGVTRQHVHENTTVTDYRSNGNQTQKEVTDSKNHEQRPRISKTRIPKEPQSEAVKSEPEVAESRPNSVIRRQRSEPGPRLNRYSSSDQFRGLKIKGESLKMNTIMMRVVAVRFSISFLPYLILVTLRLARSDIPYHLSDTGKIVYHVFLRTYFLISMVNPFIYLLMSTEFRMKLRAFGRRIFCSN